MKKRLTVAITLILLLAVIATMFVGCDEIFKRNDERDMTQVVATVKYKDQTDYVYKFELASSFNNYAYYYVNYYGMTYEAAAQYVAQSLAQQRLLVMFAKDKVAELLNVSNKANLLLSHGENGLLNETEYNHSIEETNDSLLSSLKSLIEDSIDEDEYSSSSKDDVSGDDDTDDDDNKELKDPKYVYFNANGGSDVDRQRVSKGTSAKKPTDPTRDGYTFYGWYQAKFVEGTQTVQKDEDGNVALDLEKGEWNFDKDKVNDNLTLYARWEKYTTPRTEIPDATEEDDDYDPDAEYKGDTVIFFFDKDVETLRNELKEDDEEFAKDIDNSKLDEYITSSLSELKTNLKKNLYIETLVNRMFSKEDQGKLGIVSNGKTDYVKACYYYYLLRQLETALTDKLQRKLGENVQVSEAEVKAEFNRIVERNREVFGASDSAYSNALSNSLSGTYYHPDITKDNSYGFVINILLRLDDEKLAQLTDLYNKDPRNKSAIVKLRNKLLSEMNIKVSNPNYDSTAVVEKKDENDKDVEVELRDPMTDSNNPYGYWGVTGEYDHSYEVEIVDGDTTTYNNYQQILSFEKNDDDEYEIKVNATEHPAMAYLIEEVPAFDKNGKIGIIHQIYNSFEQVNKAVTDGDLTPAQGAYWLKELATRWAYIVGDDTGAVTSSSNNNGLGYLITPEGEDSNYLAEFTEYARELVRKGTGYYCNVSESDQEDYLFNSVGSDGELYGNNKTYVAADSFVDSGSTSNAYAGIFVLLCSYKVWDPDFHDAMYAKEEGHQSMTSIADGALPLDYVTTFTKDTDDLKTISQIIEETLLEAKKSNIYNKAVNEMGATVNNENIKDAPTIEYNEKAYKSLWKDLA